MTEWSVERAKSHFSAFLDACLSEGPQVVTRRGVEVAVLAPLEQWRRANAGAGASLKSLLLAEEARSEDLAPPRGRWRRRRVQLD